MAYQPNNEAITSGTERTRVFLQPIAAPSILGLYGLAGATFMVAARMAHWYGDAATYLTLVPFAALFGGLAQFLAGMWAFKARDGIATAMHGMWGAFWMAFGGLGLIWAIGRLPVPMNGAAFPGLGFWFIVVAAITWVGAAAAMAESKVFAAVLIFFAAGATAGAVGTLTGVEAINILAGWLLIIGSIIAWYNASALMLNEAFGREVWSLGRADRARAMPPISTGAGEPGVIHGQA